MAHTTNTFASSSSGVFERLLESHAQKVDEIRGHEEELEELRAQLRRLRDRRKPAAELAATRLALAEEEMEIATLKDQHRSTQANHDVREMELEQGALRVNADRAALKKKIEENSAKMEALMYYQQQVLDPLREVREGYLLAKEDVLNSVHYLELSKLDKHLGCTEELHARLESMRALIRDKVHSTDIVQAELSTLEALYGKHLDTAGGSG